MANSWLQRVSRAFFLQDLAAKAVGLVPAIIQNNFGKYDTLKKAFYLTSHDGVEGDYLEFGVFTGASMSAAIELSKKSFLPRKEPMRYFGFDSFQGFGEVSPEERAHGWHQDENFQSDVELVRRRLAKRLPESRFKLVPGYFDKTLDGKTPADYGIGKACVVMIDCDTLSAARSVFPFIVPALQEGTILVIDDFFLYKGSSSLGVYGAYREFEKSLEGWSLRRMWTYGCGGVAVIVSK